MAGNKIGGMKCAAVNKQRHGEDFYRKIGSLGGKKSRGGGFSANRELAREMGRKGGLATKDKYHTKVSIRKMSHNEVERIMSE